MTELDRPKVIVSDNTHEQLSVLEQRDKLLAWTQNTPELVLILGEAKGKRNKRRNPLSDNEKTILSINSSIAKSTEQYSKGIEMGYYSDPKDVSMETLNQFINQDLDGLFKSLDGIDYYLDASLAIKATDLNETPEADEFAWEWFRKFTSFPSQNGNEKIITPVGKITADERMGIPIIICNDKNDLKTLTPYNLPRMEWPEDTQAFSFVVTENSRPFVGTNLDSVQFKNGIIGSLWVVAMETCPDHILDKHVMSHLSFASTISNNKATPILISKYPLAERIKENEIDIPGAIDHMVREITLQHLVTDKIAYPSFWQKSQKNRLQREYSAARSLFLRGNHDEFYNMVKHRDQDKVRELFSKRLSDTFDIIDGVVNTRFPDSKLGHLIVGNTLAYLPLTDWGHAKDILNAQTSKNLALKRLGISRR